MKVRNILGNRLVLITIFSLLLIEGEHFGGFYLLYLLLALPHGGVYSIIAFAGIIFVLAGNNINAKNLKLIFSVSGLLLMLLSLLIFFNRGDNKGATFHQSVPIISFCLFGICVLFFIIGSLENFYKKPQGGSGEKYELTTD